MGLTGLIYAAIAVAWLAYLIPTYLRRRDQQTSQEVDPRNRFSDSLRIIQSGTAPVLDQDLAPIKEVEISTPLTRRAAIADLRRLELQAAARRRRVLLILMAVVTVVLGVCAAGFVDWVWLALPGAVLIGFAMVARMSVRSMRRRMDERFAAICHGSDEKTVYLRRTDVAAEKKAAPSAAATASPASPASANAGGLWDPLPITMPTYVSKPLAPRTVRTIDLSAPDVTSAAREELPVTADAPQAEDAVEPPADAAPDADLRRAVGE